MSPALAEPLGNTTNRASHREKNYKNRLRRWALQSVARELLPDERVGFCMRGIVPNKNHVHVLYSEEIKRAHYGNLMVCGSVWVCPVCAAKITERRRGEMVQAVNQWLGDSRTVALVTYTLQHSREDKLAELRKVQGQALRALKSGRWWQEFKARWNIGASVKGSEITWGEANGWHPHAHELFFLDLGPGSFDRSTFQDEIRARYIAILARLGYYASELYGVNVQIGDEQVSNYAAKWGVAEEITKSPVKQSRKGGYTPFQLLGLYFDGKSWAGALFVEYARATKGKYQLMWSRGARAFFGLGQEQTDEELAAEQREEAYILATLTRPQWAQVLKYDKRGQLLEIASTGNPSYLWAYLAGLGVHPSEGQDLGPEYSGLAESPNNRPVSPQEGPGQAEPIERGNHGHGVYKIRPGPAPG